MFDYESGRSRGFGFVTYEDAAVARHLLSLGHEHNVGENPHLTGRVLMRDKLIEIKAAQPKESRASRSHYHNNGGRGGGGRRSGNNNNKHAVNDPPVVPAAAVAEAPYPATNYPAYPYGPVYPGMPSYGYYPAYNPTPVPYPAGYVPGYVAPVYYPHMPDVAPYMPEQQQPGMTGYAFIPLAPPQPPAAAPQEQEKK